MHAANILVSLFAFIIFCLLLNYQLTTYFVSNYKQRGIKPESDHPVHPTREGFPGAPDRVYLIFGGSGFVGSWFARYLLLRKEKKVIILDKNLPPSDLIKHGVIHKQVTLTSIQWVEQTLREIADTYCGDNTKVIIYNCSCTRKYYESLINPIVDPGLRVAEILAGNLKRFASANTVVIHVGDAMSHRIPVQFWKFWDCRYWIQHSRSDTAPLVHWGNEQQSSAFSVYAWYQGAIETQIRTIPGVTTGAIRGEGFVSGHLGDHFLTPAILYNGGLLHSWGVPIPLLHVEDLVRGGLALEYLLLDPKTASQYSGSVFTISGESVTTLRDIYEHIKLRRPSFRAIQVIPVVAYLFGWLVSLSANLYRPLSADEPDSKTSILVGQPKTLTLARFMTLHIGQLHNKANVKRNLEVLKYRPNFSVSQIIDSVIDEVDAMEKRKKRRQSSINAQRPQIN